MLNVMKARNIQERTFDFACRIVHLHDYLYSKRGAARALARQLLDAGTSIGANLEEASAAESKRDFISKCGIAAKEARETRYWLRLLGRATASVSPQRITPLIIEAGEIVAILMTIVRNAQKSPHRLPAFNIQH